MTERKRWPDAADGQRMDAIALQLDIKMLGVQLHEALRRGALVEAAALNEKMVRKADKAQRLLQEARRC